MSIKKWLKWLFSTRIVYVDVHREVIVDGYHDSGASVTMRPGDTLDVDWITDYKYNPYTEVIEAFDREGNKTGECPMLIPFRSEKKLSISFPRGRTVPGGASTITLFPGDVLTKDGVRRKEEVLVK